MPGIESLVSVDDFINSIRGLSYDELLSVARDAPFQGLSQAHYDAFMELLDSKRATESAPDLSRIHAVPGQNPSGKPDLLAPNAPYESPYPIWEGDRGDPRPTAPETTYISRNESATPGPIPVYGGGEPYVTPGYTPGIGGLPRLGAVDQVDPREAVPGFQDDIGRYNFRVPVENPNGPGLAPRTVEPPVPAASPQGVPLGEPQNEPQPPYMFERGVPETPAAESNSPSEPTLQDRILSMIEDYVFTRQGATETNPALAANAENLQPNMYSDLARLGFGMASGESPFFGVNVGNAGLGMMDARQSGFADYQNALFDIEQLDISNRNSDIAAESARMGTAAELYRLTQPQATENPYGSLPPDLVMSMYKSRVSWIEEQLKIETDPARIQMLTDQLLSIQSEYAPMLGELAPILFNSEPSTIDLDTTQ